MTYKNPALVADIESAILIATDFDVRDVDHNFACDYQAYAHIERGFKELIRIGHLEAAKVLAIRLMKNGSYQVECSDEGMMTEDIEACLKPVIRAVKSVGGDASREWAFAMVLEDRVGFICEEDLKRLADRS
ncbi:MAG: hypothetical protein AAFN77_22435 [Planctomycetota bacterium]